MRKICCGLLLVLVVNTSPLFIPNLSATIFIQAQENDTLKKSFLNPPDESRPGVFWQWMGGLLSKEGMTKDLEAMASQGIGGVMVMQMPDQAPYPQRWDFREYPGKIEVLSDEWFDVVNHAIGEADRLGITFSIFICPGWSHAGGPWVTPEQGLKKLVFSSMNIKGGSRVRQSVPRAPRSVGMGGGNEVPDWFNSDSPQKPKQQEEFYQDVAVIAVPAPEGSAVIAREKVIDISKHMDSKGMLNWQAPAGTWNVMRLGLASENGVNHPAPFEATGLEADRMDSGAVRTVFDGMIARIIREAKAKGYRSFKAFETDSYEGGIQDFGKDFRQQFKKRRGYDCVPWLPVWLDKNMVIDNKELTNRFRNDMTWTISELIVERFHGKLRSLADEHKVEWMVEPYFRLRIDWRSVAAQSALSGSEFWIGKPFGYIGPAPDIAALYGLPIVWAESFTAESYTSAWRNDPAILKPWGDAIFARGINQIYMHGFVHNPFGDHLRPGMTMGYWGTQFGRHLTWWPYSADWHRYLTRSQFMLRQGRPVNDVLVYPGEIHPVPNNAIDAGPFRQVVLTDEALFERISVRNDGRLTVKGGGDFAAIAITPGLALRPESLQKIIELVENGATLIALPPPAASPSLHNYPECDQQLVSLIKKIWKNDGTGTHKESSYGRGKVMATQNFSEALNKIAGGPDVIFRKRSGDDKVILNGVPEIPFRMAETQLLTDPSMQVNSLTDEAFKSMDFVHRKDGKTDIYFVCNTGSETHDLTVDFRISGKTPELWDPLTGRSSKLADWSQQNDRTLVTMQFEPQRSYFVVFSPGLDKNAGGNESMQASAVKTLKTLDGPWKVSFDKKWGGPGEVEFKKLSDWSEHTNNGIKYYSGAAVYRQSFELSALPTGNHFIELGVINDLARITLNDSLLGTIWCSPWKIEIPAGVLKKGKNSLKIEVVNTWVNRLIGDEHEPEDAELIEWNPDTKRKGSYDINVGSRGLKDLPDWVINNTPRPSKGRYTFTSWRFYDKTAPLQPAGLVGPVKIVTRNK